MTATLLFILAGFIFAGGAVLFGAAQKGEQQTLGGIVAMIALLLAALGALARVAGFSALLFIEAAGARDIDGRYAGSPLKPWFDQLKSGGGALCCSDADGTAISDTDWRSKDGGYEVFLEGQWMRVPDEAVVTEPNRAGRTMVWPLRGYMGLTIRCFMPGPMT